MSGNDLMDLAVLERKKYNYLNEVLDLTQQIGEAADRNDQVALKMLVAMRQDPILGLREVDATSKDRRRELTPERRERIDALLAGAPAEDERERAFVEQAGRARRLLEKVVALDRRISLRMAGEHSFYHTRESTSP